MNKKYIAIIVSVFIIICIFVLIGYFYTTNTQKGSRIVLEQDTNTNTNLNSTLNTNSATEEQVNSNVIDTSDWKTYRNEEYGFEFKYPEDWIVRNDKSASSQLLILIQPSTMNKINNAIKNSLVEIPRGDIVITIYKNQTSVKNYLASNNQDNKIDLISFNKINLNNLVAYEAILGGMSKNYSIYFQLNTNIVQFLFELCPDANFLSIQEKSIIKSINLL